MTKTANFWNHLLSTLWFVPILLAVCGVLLGFLFVGIDLAIGEKYGYFPRYFGVEPSGAGNVLAIIAGSTITVAGTVYSITIVALTLASTQFSPRILRNFMRDTGNQVVLGVLVGIFAYCIIVLRTIKTDGGDGENFVPSIAVMFGVLLGLLGVGFLIYFIHHVAISIQATSIISNIAEETIAEIKKPQFGEAQKPATLDEKNAAVVQSTNWLEISSTSTGYVQNADTKALFELAEKYDSTVKMQRRVGEFVVGDLPLLQIAPSGQNFQTSQNVVRDFNAAYDFGSFRTVEGDIAFGLRQIVDIALKALSPAINDSTTGITCIDYLTAILAELIKRPSPPPYIFSDDGKLRVIVNCQRFEDFFDLAFNQIRQNAGGNLAIIIRLFNALEILHALNERLSAAAKKTERRELFSEQLQMLEELSRETIKTEKDLQKVLRIYDRTAKSLA